MATPLSDLSADIDGLYRLPFAEFTNGRNALAARVKGEQGKDAAAAVKALEKPSLSAWVVNQLFWRHRKAFDRLITAGDDLRSTQQLRLAGRDGDVNAAIDARREALSALMSKVAELLGESGSASPDIRQRVGTTLEALSVYGTSEAAPRAGRLTGDVQPPGFAALAALVPAGPAASPSSSPAAPVARKPGSGLRVVEPPSSRGRGRDAEEEEEDEEEDKPAAKAAGKAAEKKARKALEKARTALDEAETTLAQARKEAQQATTAQTRAQAEWDAARDHLDAIQKTLDEAMERERVAQIARDERRRAALQATQAVNRAERARDEADRYLQSLDRG